MEGLIARIRTRQQAASVVAFAGGALLLLLLLVASATGVIPTGKGGRAGATPSPTTQPPAETCTNQVHFYAVDAPAGSNRFGPELVDQSIEAGTARWGVKLCTDPAFTAVWEDVIVHNLANGTPEWYDQRARQFVTEPAEWQKAIAAINDKIDTINVEDRSETYHTLLMVPRGDDVPVVRRTNRPVAMGHVLVFHLKDGRTEYARYVCDLQPARPDFPKVPPESVPPPPPGKPPVTTPPTTPSTVPPTTPTTPPTSPPTTVPSCPSGKCTPPVTVAPPPVTVPPPAPPQTMPPPSDSGDGAYNTVPPPVTVAPAPAPPITSPPVTNPPPPAP